jgi:peptidoglycan/LPS O-acetylase OafA/YrhL
MAMGRVTDAKMHGIGSVAVIERASPTVNSGQLSHPKYRRDIDGLRAVAVLSVLAFHGFSTAVPGGFIGVDIFFVISGYLISSIIFENLEQHHFSYVEFYSRRIRRIFPALTVVLAFTYGAGWLLLFPEEFRALGKHTAAGAGFLSNLFLYMERGYFDSSAEAKPLLHLWSLGVEEQFYIVWPLLLGLVWKRRFGLVGTTLAVALASFALNLQVLQHDSDAAFYSPLTRFWELMLGGLLAYWKLHRPGASTRHDNWAALGGAALIASGLLIINRTRAFPGWWALLPTLGACLIIWAHPDTWFNRRILGNSVAVWIGKISYPLYLWHWPLLSLARIVEGHAPGARVRMTALAASFVLAAATYQWIETPIRRGRFGTRRVVVALAASMVLLGAIGAITFVDDGFEFRQAARNFPVTPVREFLVSRASNGSCERMLAKRSLKDEICLANDPHPDVMIIGDSHAAALNAAAYLHRVPLKTLLLSALACPPYPNITFIPLSATNYGNNCQEIANDELATAQSLPSIRTVVVATHYGDLARFAYRDAEGVSLSVRDAFLEGNSYLARSLLSLGKRVVFVIDVPTLKVAPINCVPRLFKPDPPSCSVAYADALDAQREYRDWVARLRASIPQIVVYDAFSALCDAHTCQARDDQHFFYQDNDHLTVRGSEQVLSGLERSLPPYRLVTK